MRRNKFWMLRKKSWLGAFLGEKKKGYLSKRDKLCSLDVSSSAKAKPPSHENEKLVRVLREQKKGIGLKVANIQEISPLIGTHKILMEKGFKLP